ncbi:hypothetical protein FA13DRAFT_1708116 [Coprinellus micaceus]|uniref:Uncharacterized protein n=1 Tax=Coprinellus micaceus TaxID=71717 RepID=A0A4Y7TK81_COPMI|nr:hypothetical protein FA13DRAFT_1708116 [Coprinellus micaceus]
MGPTPFLTIESSYMYIGSTGNLNTGVNNDCHGTRANRWKTPLGGSDLTPDDCLELMEQYSSIRIACHADYYPGEPHQSRFLFHKGQLSLNEILKKSLENAVLAYTWWMDTRAFGQPASCLHNLRWNGTQGDCDWHPPAIESSGGLSLWPLGSAKGS